MEEKCPKEKRKIIGKNQQIYHVCLTWRNNFISNLFKIETYYHNTDKYGCWIISNAKTLQKTWGTKTTFRDIFAQYFRRNGIDFPWWYLGRPKQIHFSFHRAMISSSLLKFEWKFVQSHLSLILNPFKESQPFLLHTSFQWQKIKDASHARRQEGKRVPAEARKKFHFPPCRSHSGWSLLSFPVQLGKIKWKFSPASLIPSSSSFVGSRRWQNREAASSIWKCCFLWVSPLRGFFSLAVSLNGKILNGMIYSRQD